MYSEYFESFKKKNLVYHEISQIPHTNEHPHIKYIIATSILVVKKKTAI